MKLGFTGSQRGMTSEQYKAIWEYVSVICVPGDEIHHGDCIGSDSEIHDIGELLKLTIVVHPPLDERKRAFCVPTWGIILPEEDFMIRNRSIVEDCEFLIGAPKGFKEELRSGTWMTLRWAKKTGRRFYIFWPDSSVTANSFERK